MPTVIGISIGDVSGIGPEVTAEALERARVRRVVMPVVFGDGPTLERFRVFKRYKWVRPSELKAPVLKPTVCVVTELGEKDRLPGQPTRKGGRAQYAYIEAAIAAAKAGVVKALCTAPVSKEQITRAGVQFMGHTEMLAEAFGVEQVMMMMEGPRLRVALATNHVPLAEVPKRLTVPGLVGQMRLLTSSLEPVLGRKPRIAVLALNPHAGEGGLLGSEEEEILEPAIRQARKLQLEAHGPFPADGLFPQVERLGYDVVLALYHDQGLIPAKALDFDSTVNVTLGLPVPRTSPDHGTAYAIAGKNEANSLPMVEALVKAAELVRR